MTRRIARLVACCAAAALVWACGPVFIPVPPPTQTAFTLDTSITDPEGNQYWIAAGGSAPRAANGTYYIFDRDRNSGVIAGAMADGSYIAPPMRGVEGDRVLINYKDVTGKFSAVACLILSEARPAAAVCPP